MDSQVAEAEDLLPDPKALNGPAKSMRFVRGAGWTMIGAGTLIIAFLAYQLLFTNLLNSRSQNRAETALEQKFEEARVAPLEPVVLTPTSPPSTVVKEDQEPVPVTTPISFYEEASPELGTAFGRIVIPKIDLDVVIFEGVERNTLKQGPGHMPWTPLPGQAGNAVVSGHRTTYGAPFYDLDVMEPGDEIFVETVIGESTYVVREILIVKPTDVWVTDNRPGAWLTLTTCNPRFSARERLIIVAEMVDGPNFEYAQALLDGVIDVVGS